MNYSTSLVCTDSLFGSITLCISNSKEVYSFGHNNCSAHGHKEKYILPPKPISGLINIKMISIGISHSICLDENDNVFSFGNNEKGQLGINKTKEELAFTHIPQKLNIPHCKQISCCLDSTICLTEDGILYSFGFNGDGQLGLGHKDNSLSPQQIPNLINIKYIECGGMHVICQSKDNSIYSWGNNSGGQLGHNSFFPTCAPTLCNNWPDNIISIKSGLLHNLLLTSTGTVYSFGFNNLGQLGINDVEIVIKPTLIKNIHDIQRIECGRCHSMCLDYENNLWVFGNNYDGQLGLDDRENRYQPILHPKFSNIIDISSGGEHTFVKTKDDKIYGFGKNGHAQLGIKTSKEYQLTPIQVLEDNKDIWRLVVGKSKAKSARK